jgi:hypothetical protein
MLEQSANLSRRQVDSGTLKYFLGFVRFGGRQSVHKRALPGGAHSQGIRFLV